MPFQVQHSCNFPDCRTPTQPGQSFCDKHSDQKRIETNATDKFRNRTNKVRQFEMGSVWRTVRKAFLTRNPLCQAIVENGQQCRYASCVVHHLIAPEVNPALQIAWHNLVGVCKSHHITTTGDSGKLSYTPTTLFDGTEFPHDIPLTHRERTGWHKPLAPIGSTARPEFATSSVGESAIDAALAEDI